MREQAKQDQGKRPNGKETSSSHTLDAAKTKTKDAAPHAIAFDSKSQTPGGGSKTAVLADSIPWEKSDHVLDRAKGSLIREVGKPDNGAVLQTAKPDAIFKTTPTQTTHPNPSQAVFKQLEDGVFQA